MDFSLSPEQLELKDAAHSFLADRFPLKRVADLVDSAEGWDPDSWRELAALGWLGVCLDEDHGGAGLGFVEQALLLEELGYALYPGPYFATVALALPALGPEEQIRVATGEARWSAEIDGLVPDILHVDEVVTVDGAADASRGEVLLTIDPTRALGRVGGDVRKPLPGTIDRTRMLVALSAEAVGVAQRALDLAVEHANTRRQFGRLVGSFQAVAHPLANCYADVEVARSLAYWAAWCIDDDPAQATTAAHAAKAFAAEAAVHACERSIQTHGGIGFTWEHPLHRFYKRALWLQAFAGYPRVHRAQVAASVLEQTDGRSSGERMRMGERSETATPTIVKRSGGIQRACNTAGDAER